MGMSGRRGNLAPKPIALAGLLALASGCQRDGTVDPVVAETARAIGAPRTANDLRLKAARGEGRTLILEAEMPADVASLVRSNDVATSFALGICANPRGANFFSDGRTLRVDLSVPGRGVSSATVNRCPPGAAGQGVSVETYAQLYRRMVGRDLGDGSTIAATRVEGQTLVLVINGRRGSRAGITPATITQQFLSEFCDPASGNAFFAGGRALRIDTTEDGANLMQGEAVSACPARAAAR